MVGVVDVHVDQRAHSGSRVRRIGVQRAVQLPTARVIDGQGQPNVAFLQRLECRYSDRRGDRRVTQARGQLVLRGEDILPDQRGTGGVCDGFGRHDAGAQSGERCGADADDHRVEITRLQTGFGDGAGDVALESFDMGARIGFDDRLASDDADRRPIRGVDHQCARHIRHAASCRCLFDHLTVQPSGNEGRAAIRLRRTR